MFRFGPVPSDAESACSCYQQASCGGVGAVDKDLSYMRFGSGVLGMPMYQKVVNRPIQGHLLRLRCAAMSVNDWEPVAW